MRQVRRQRKRQQRSEASGSLQIKETDGKEPAKDHKCQVQPMKGPGCPLHLPFPPQGHLKKADESEKWKWLGSLVPLLSAFGFSNTCPAFPSAPSPYIMPPPPPFTKISPAL